MGETLDTMAHAEQGEEAGAWFTHGTSRIYYEVTGSGDPVLLMPGWGGNIGEFMALRVALVQANYQVIAADLPGSGRSLPQPRTYTHTYYHDDAQSLAALLDELAVGPAHCLGFSDGGEVALLMAASTPNPARSPATWGAAGQLNDPEGHLRQAMVHMVDNPIPPMQRFRDYLVATYGETNARVMTTNFAAALDAIYATAGGDISFSIAHKIASPVLLIAGEHDFFAPLDLLTQLSARIPNVEVSILEGAGHNVHESHSAWLTQTVLDWLRHH